MILAYFQYYQCARPHLLLKPPKGGWKMPQSSDLACTLCDPKNKSGWASKFNSIFFHGNWLILVEFWFKFRFLCSSFSKFQKKKINTRSLTSASQTHFTLYVNWGTLFKIHSVHFFEQNNSVKKILSNWTIFLILS